MNGQWVERAKPARLEGRYEFPDYEALRDFLDRAAKISEEKNYYPDMGFGKDYVNVTIHPEEESEMLNENRKEFAVLLDDLVMTLDETS